MCPWDPMGLRWSGGISLLDSGDLREKNRDILHFHQVLRATDGPEIRIEAQECGHSFMQPPDQKDHSTTIATIDDAVVVVLECRSYRVWHAHTLVSSSGYQEM